VPAVTKPGNSDPEPTAAEAAPDPAVPAEETTSSLAPDPVEPAPATGTGQAGAGPASEKTEAVAAEPAEPTEPTEPAAKPSAGSAAEPAAKAPVRRKVEKAPPIRADEPVMPTAREAAALRAQAKRRFEEPAPRTLRFSFYFFVASGLVWLASMVASIIYKQDIVDAEVERSMELGTELTADQIANGVTQILWIVTIAAVTFTVFLGLFGYKATEGTRRARTLVTIFATVLVLFHLLLNGTPPGILSAFLSLTALALLWSPSARRYFAPRERR
jgi:hypothetical protein